MYTIQTLNKISPLGLGQLDEKEFTVTDTCENPDGILVRSADMHEMKFGSNLRAIARAGAGDERFRLGVHSEPHGIPCGAGGSGL